MEYIGIGICVIAVVAICIFIVQRKKHAQEANSNENVKTNAEECAIAVSNDTPTELVIGLCIKNHCWMFCIRYRT